MAAPEVSFNDAAQNVGKMMGTAYQEAFKVSEYDDLALMTQKALEAQMKMTAAKTGNDMVSKAINQSKECMKSCTQSM